MTRDRRSIQLHIEELVLDGFTSVDHYRLRETVQAELTRLIAEHGLPPSLKRRREIARIDTRTLQLAPASSAEIIGRKVAEAIHQGFNE